MDDSSISRRDALKKAGVVGGVIFVAPIVSSISMSRASAAQASGGRGNNDGQGQNYNNQR